MPKTKTRAYSRYTLQVVQLLGRLIRTARIENRMTTRELSERAGISRDMLYRIEKGDPRAEIGVAFELAAILKIQLFESERDTLRTQIKRTEDRLALLPKAIRSRKKEEVPDDF